AQLRRCRVRLLRLGIAIVGGKRVGGDGIVAARRLGVTRSDIDLVVLLPFDAVLGLDIDGFVVVVAAGEAKRVRLCLCAQFWRCGQQGEGGDERSRAPLHSASLGRGSSTRLVLPVKWMTAPRSS